ncbi:cystathionine beta-lyase [Bacillus sp. AFS018417]|uniref:MalY/PatB family protein n=1 Tax=Bacillus sp. AFS018417 TaxID=2033491 RepID=UPI000BF6FF7C|nr:MalY/PatB family protein [Bacillus sp. AFS018417]PEZ06045.1 cystathionine beta-lyase [Bacillus sp. AFS018417]
MGNFNEMVNRRGTNSVKWDTHKNEELLHAWIADMDFPVPSPIQDALTKRLQHPIFGYNTSSEQVKEAICHWVKTQYNWVIEKEWLVFSAGIVPALSVSVQAFTEKQDSVLVQPPVYSPFFEMVTTNGRQVLTNPLRLENGVYKMDFEQLEKQFQQGVKLMFLCSPHNPIGRVWTVEELTKLGTLCEIYDVIVIADEIHADIIFNGRKHIPLASLSANLAERTVTCIAPSKTFNIAGLQASVIIIPNEKLRDAFTAVQHRQGFHGLNTFAYAAMQSAYTECNEWLAELLPYIEENARFACDFIKQHIPKLSVIQPDGTFLLWIDCSKLGLTQNERMELLEKKGRIIVEPGEKFGVGGEQHIRLNLGCPRPVLEDALRRLQCAFSCTSKEKLSM